MTMMLSGGAKALLRAALGAVTVLLALPSAKAQDRAEPFGFAGTPWQIGGFVFVTPKFEGAKSYDVLGFPFLAPAGFGQGGGSAIDIRGTDDVRFRLLARDGFEAGPLPATASGAIRMTPPAWPGSAISMVGSYSAPTRATAPGLGSSPSPTSIR
jgi:hypothetical protein